MQRYGTRTSCCAPRNEQSAVEIRDVVRWQDRGFVTLKRPNVFGGFGTVAEAFGMLENFLRHQEYVHVIGKIKNGWFGLFEV